MTIQALKSRCEGILMAGGALAVLIGLGTGCSFSSGPQDLSRKIIQELPQSTVLLEFNGTKIRAGDVEAEVHPELERMREEAVRSYRFQAEALVKKKVMDEKAKTEGFSDQEAMNRKAQEKIQVTDAQVSEYLKKNRLEPAVAPEIQRFLQEQAWLIEKTQREQSALKSVHIDWKITPAFHPMGSGLTGLSFGPKDAPIEIHEFCDLKNPLCASWTSGLERLLLQYPAKVKWTFHPLPNLQQSGAEGSARGVVCAGEQNRFREFAHAFLQAQRDRSVTDVLEIGKKAGLEGSIFQQCLSNAGPTLVQEQSQAKHSGVAESPAVFVKGERADSMDEVEARVAQLLALAHE